MKSKTALGIVVLVGLIAILPYKLKPHTSAPKASGVEITSASTELTSPGPKFVGVTVPPKLSAKAVLALDLKTGRRLFAQNETKELPIASLTKLMTAMVVLDHTSKDKIVTIEKSDTEVECSCMDLVEGERITVENLLKGMLIPSNNDAATALARSTAGSVEAFVELMNKKAKGLGLSNSHFSTPVGFDVPENYSTAVDLAVIAQEFLKYSMLERIVATAGVDVSSVDGSTVHHLKTSNKLLLGDSEVVGVKTGFTTDAQGNLILKIDHDKALVLTIVLNTPDREQETEKFIDWIFRSYSWE